MMVTGRSAGAIAAILLIVRAASSYSTDQEISALFSSAAQMDAAGNGLARDAIIQEIRTELRSRIAADSAANSAVALLDLLDEVLEEQEATRVRLTANLRAQAARGDTNSLKAPLEALRRRYPSAQIPSLESLLAIARAKAVKPPVTDSVDSCLSAEGCRPVPSPTSSLPAKAPVVASGCAHGSPRTGFLRPLGQSVRLSDSALLLTVRIHAPCPLDSIELRIDSVLARKYPPPESARDSFDLDDAIALGKGAREISISACDTFGSCHRSTIVFASPDPIPPWIPWTVGGIVVLGLLTGVVALFRHPSAGSSGTNARGIQVRPTQPAPGASSTTSKFDVVQELKRIVANQEKDIPRGPRLITRLNALPPLECDPQRLESALDSLLRLPIARAGLRGTVLVATGRGPVSIEIVFEDNGPDIDDAILKLLFDPSSTRLRDRHGLDKELLGAADSIMRMQGHLSVEPRIDGGIRLRVRLPLQSASGPRANSLLK